MLYKYYYKKAMMRYKETEMSEKDKKLCSAVEAVTLEAANFVGKTVTYTVATPFILGEIAVCLGGIAVHEIKKEVIKSYDEYVKENGTQI